MSDFIQPNIWYFPSAYGDIRLEQPEGSSETRCIFYSLTPREAEALQGLRKASLSWRKKWATPEAWDELGANAFEVGERVEHHIVLRAKLGDVAAVLNKQLNPDRRTVHVVRIGQGKIEEISEDRFASPEQEAASVIKHLAASTEQQKVYEESQAAKIEASAQADPPHRREPPKDLVPVKSAAVVKATTIKEPIIGCPAPDFAAIARRATRVLKAWLTPEQVNDYETHQRFIVRGADTGHQYMLISRNAPSVLKSYGSRSVFDINERRALCVHDWDVPAEEELLGLALLLQLPGRESWVRHIPDQPRHPHHG